MNQEVCGQSTGTLEGFATLFAFKDLLHAVNGPAKRGDYKIQKKLKRKILCKIIYMKTLSEGKTESKVRKSKICERACRRKKDEQKCE